MSDDAPEAKDTNDDLGPEPMSWGAIVGIMIAVGLGCGLTLGALGELVGRTLGTAGVGAAMGAVGGLLIARRSAALTRRANAGARG